MTNEERKWAKSLGQRLSSCPKERLAQARGEKPAAPVRVCCVETPEELELMRNGDYNAEELYGAGGKPSCPKCAGKRDV